MQSLLEGVIVGAANRGETKASEELLEEHEHLSQEARMQVVKLEPMYIVDWEEAQEADAASGFISEGHTTSTVEHLPQGVPQSGD